MSKLFSLNHDTVLLNKANKLIKAQDIQNFIQALDILQAAKEQADSMQKQALEQFDKGYADGFAKGQAEGKQEYALKIIDSVMTTLDSLELIEEQIVDVVIASVVKIIGQIEPNERIVRIVKQALATVRGENRIQVKVSLEQEACVRQSLRAFLISPDGKTGYIDVVADSSLKKDDCILETKMGVVEASLDFQLKVLDQAFRQKVKMD